MKLTNTEKAIAQLEGKIRVLQLAIEKLKATQTKQATRKTIENTRTLSSAAIRP